jgi:hypothetical protein
MNKPIARNIDEGAKILGFAPLEIALLGVLYAILSSVLRGVPFSALLALGGIALLAGVILTLNRIYPPQHGIFFLLRLIRPPVTPVMRYRQRNSLS